MNRNQAEALFDILEKLDEIKNDIRVSATQYFSHDTSGFDLLADIEQTCSAQIRQLTNLLETPSDSRTWLDLFENS